MSKQYKLQEGSLQHQFQQSRAKIQIFGGGFGNGKTTASVIKTLAIARDYPGINILLARATYPKLEDSLRKEFLDWCPAAWIKSKNLSDENKVVLHNGSTINFRAIQQKGKTKESSTSNLLSNTYGLIVLDQAEDPEIVFKDFNDLLGRLRQSVRYVGDDPTMPLDGPRFLILTCNPTRNWVYKKLIKPLHDYKKGIPNPDLFIDEETKEPIIELFEGSTYTNKDNLPADFISTLELTYKGQMRDRYLEGSWGAYEGLVYPEYDDAVHLVKYDAIIAYFQKLLFGGYLPNVIEAYDHGIAKPAAYGLALVDPFDNIFVIAGYYKAESPISMTARKIKHLRSTLLYNLSEEIEFDLILADPAIFRRSSTDIGETVANLFFNAGIKMTRAYNKIDAGIQQLKTKLTVVEGRQHPILDINKQAGIYFADHLNWIDEEISEYRWQKDTEQNYTDLPVDRNDHAMDMLRYIVSRRKTVRTKKPRTNKLPKELFQMHEILNTNTYQRRYLNG